MIPISAQTIVTITVSRMAHVSPPQVTKSPLRSAKSLAAIALVRRIWASLFQAW
jgi:hypothetical protein